MTQTAANGGAQPPVTTFDPETKYRLILRVDAAEDLAHKSSQGAYCKLFVGDSAQLDGSQKKLTKSTSTESAGSAGGADDDNNADGSSGNSFRTQTRVATANPASGKLETTWDETFEVSLRDPSNEVLSLRVKSQHRFFCPVVGTFAVYLRHLRVGHQADQWFPLRRGKKDVGRIRLHLLVTPEGRGGKKKRRGGSDLAPDIKVALAANFEADRAIQRLVDKQLKDEESRRQRRLRGELSDEDAPDNNNNNKRNNNKFDNNSKFDNNNNNNNNNNAAAGLQAQMEAISIAKVREPVATTTTERSKLGSGRGEPRFAVLLPTSPAHSSVPAPRNEGLARLKQLEPIAAVKDDGRRLGDALGSGRGGARVSVPSSPAGPVASSPAHRGGFFGSDLGPSAASASTSTGRVLTEAERNRRRAENFARLEELEASTPAPAAIGVPVGSGRGSSRRSLPNTPSGRGGSARSAREALYSIPSFGPDELSLRGKRHSGASSTDSDSLAEYERRLDRKLRKVRRETEKLRKIKRQLRKYIPDLTDSESSESDSDSDSDASPRASNQRARGSKSRADERASAGAAPVGGDRGSRRAAVEAPQPQPQEKQRYYF